MRNQGFSLIEIVAVGAVLGAIAAIVLFSVKAIRNESSDVRIKVILSDMRLKAEEYFIKYGKYWGGSGEGITGFVNRTSGVACCTAGTIFNETDGICNDLRSTLDNLSSPWNITCSLGDASHDSWAAAVVLKKPTISNGQWCVDSSGNAKEIGPTLPSTLGGATTKAQCP